MLLNKHMGHDPFGTLLVSGLLIYFHLLQVQVRAEECQELWRCSGAAKMSGVDMRVILPAQPSLSYLARVRRRKGVWKVLVALEDDVSKRYYNGSNVCVPPKMNVHWKRP